MIIVCFLFLFFEYALRLSDSVIIPELSRAFHLHALTLGMLSSSYYIIYILMQIPAGLLLDRFGLKRVMSLACLLLALSSILMGNATQYEQAIMARLLMGLASSFAFIGSIKYLHQIIPNDRLSWWVGVTITIGTLGAVFGQAPWMWVTKTLGDWRIVYDIVGILLISVSAVLFYTLPEQHRHNHSFQPALYPIRWHRNLFKLVFYIALISAPLTAFVALWGVPFLTHGFHYTRQSAADYMSLAWIAGLIGGPLFGFLGNVIRQPYRLLILTGIMVAILMETTLLVPLSPLWESLVWFLLGLLCNANVVVFAILLKPIAFEKTGFMTGFINMCNMAGGPLFQLLIGAWLSSATVKHYFPHTLSLYQIGLSVIPLCLFVVSLYFLREQVATILFKETN